ncbi:MAG: RHS repeat-associated core domain-containing protein [Terracidiphilus sp.]
MEISVQTPVDPERLQAEKDELNWLLTSGVLGRSSNLARMLTFVCEKHIQGQDDQITEYSIATEALGRRDHFDPQNDTIVRVTAHSLRKRLQEIYQTDGVNRPVHIQIPLGNYMASFVHIGANGFKPTNDYILGPGGEQVTEMGMDTNGNGNSMVWQHTNVYAAGSLIATYDNDGLHFYLNDWLGTRRAQTDYAGVLEQSCQSLPYGDGLNCVSAAADNGQSYTASLLAPTEQHFTGKERDAESGNDYFGARYYASSMGRFMSPDWSSNPSGVPYASYANPQTLNLYGYMHNNPLSGVDADGHVDWGALWQAGKEVVGALSAKVGIGVGWKATAGSKGAQLSGGVSLVSFAQVSKSGVTVGVDAKLGAEAQAPVLGKTGIGGTAEMDVVKDNHMNYNAFSPGGKLWETDTESGVGAFTDSSKTISIGGELGDEGDISGEIQINKADFAKGFSDAWSAIIAPSPTTAPPPTPPPPPPPSSAPPASNTICSPDCYNTVQAPK